jgi:two-component system, sensor histidine kinase
MRLTWWHNLSVSKKLYSVVGVMALLIATELVTLYFAMNTLSAVRAFVGGEGLWSKAQKNSVYFLHRYAVTRDEKFYQLYLNELSVPLGDHDARIEMEKPEINLDSIKDGFIRGQIHPDDIEPMVNLVRRFYKVPQLARAIDRWREADALIVEFMNLATELKSEINKTKPNPQLIDQSLSKITELDSLLTVAENEFSFALGEASRWLENILMILLICTVVTVESTVLFLTFRFGQNLTRILSELNKTAVLVGQGDLSLQIPVHSKDELGQLSHSINGMIESLRQQTNERQSAEHASQAKNLFLANMSHEIRTPLNAILGFSELLQDPSISAEEKVRFAAIIKRTGASLTTIINDILDVAKVEAEQVEIELTQFSLHQLLSDLQTMLRLRCEEKNIQLSFRQRGFISEYILSDQIRLRQILANVIGNSIKFTNRGSVDVIYEVRESDLCFTVKDTGSGITKEQAQLLFRPFSQGDNSVRKKYGGTGLGLVISQKLSRLLGGDVQLQKSEPNKGSTFFVSVQYRPVQKAKNLFPAPANPTLRDESILKNKRILVVEDSLDNQMIAQLFLSKSGALPDFANNGEEGIEKATKNPYDVILMDIQMPVMDGYTATIELRKAGLTIPIIALTGYAMKEDQEKCLKAGCNEFLSKPYDRAKLINCLLNYI